MSEVFNSAQASFPEICEQLRMLYLADPRPWLVGFSGGKDSTLVAALVFEPALANPPAQRTQETHVVCTDTRVEIPAGVEAIETTLARMRKCATEHDLKSGVHHLCMSVPCLAKLNEHPRVGG